MGWPSRNQRYYGMALNEATFVWLGPAAEDITSDFLRWFGKVCRIEGDCFVGLSGDVEYKATIQQLAATRGSYPTHEQVDQLMSMSSWRCPLGNTARDALDAGLSVMKDGSRTGYAGSVIVDSANRGSG